LPPERIDIALELAQGLSQEQLALLRHDWLLWAHAAQMPPEGDWTTWLLIGGRGSGKTRAGAEWVRSLATGASPVSRIALVGETMAQARAVMVEGESGIMRVHPDDERPRFDVGRAQLFWDNGATAYLLPANDPERFRGPQFAAAWCDELAKWPKAETTWDMLQFGLRLGPHPRQLVTTTPRPTRLLKRLLAEKGTVTTRMASTANRRNLAPSFFAAIVERYQETALGRQELDGEMIEEVAGALWKREALEANRIAARPALDRVIVALDPPVTGHARSDACGIVVAGRSGDVAVVLADRTVQGTSPVGWARAAITAWYEFEADAVVAEVNQGGDLVKEVLAQVDAGVPVRTVRATRGKWVRAEPVAALYAQGRVKHLGLFADLEDELCAFGPDGLEGGRSPDRMDALVWAITELMLKGGAVPRVRV